MTSRKKNIIIIQITLLVSALILLFLTYTNFSDNSENKIFTNDIKSKIDKKIKKEEQTSGNIFYDIEYSGLDLSGNRYILKAKEAINDDSVEGLLNLKFVNAFFYFKNNKVLNISSDKGLYNNKTLDMTFEKNVYGIYEGSTLLSEKAEYFNSKNILIVTENVKVNDIKGQVLAEKLVFDINKNTLDISSTKNRKVNANIKIK
tara:strand:+ start:1478 stop:2086 length:609 start_codon:yes stop_codon:yes gene_type:complete